MRRIVVTGAGGLIGWHAHVRLHAANCAARYRGAPPPHDIVALDHAQFDDDATLERAVAGADAILHFAGVNRAPDAVLEAANPAIAERLVAACRASGARPHLVHANSIHAGTDTPYGRSKARAGACLQSLGGGFTDLVLPHVFGEGARPHYNTVTATLIDGLIAGRAVPVNPAGRVRLLHAGAAAQAAIDAGTGGTNGPARIAPEGAAIDVPDLLDRLRGFHDAYGAGIFPDVSDPLDLALFNSYRAATYPGGWPRALTRNTDHRGTLYETARARSGGQSFVSTTGPGITRGDHFHLDKVERFHVLRGQAVIRIRKVLSGKIWEYRVSGDDPAVVDMPTLHTHSIENVGDGDLLTLFWTHDHFDPSAPDTFADKVLP